jgi:hypothetical protein
MRKDVEENKRQLQVFKIILTAFIIKEISSWKP